MPWWLGAIIAIVALAVGIILGITYRKKVSEKEISSAEEEAKRIINEAIKTGESKQREALLEAKESIHKERVEYEREVKERRSELQKQERRLQSKEENLDKKTDNIEKKSEQLTKKLSEADALREEVKLIKRSELEMLEKISGYTQEEAKTYLIQEIESEVTHEKAMKIKELETRFKDEADEKAREIITHAIHRCAADHVAEATVSVVPLPNDEMKGRVIGREGRNIRTIETLTGVDLIIDDTPEAITLSSFDPYRREIARVALEKLITDGRIHPARIEETVEKARREVEATVKAEGERATFETGVHGLNPELIKLLGRQKYRTSYGQNVLKHSIEVSHIAGLLAAELGVDVTMAKRAGLLHDIGKSIDHEVEGSHVAIGVELARKYKENEQIVHAIQAHHGDVEPQTLVACIVQAADTISAARPGARRENIENYIKRLEKLEELTNSFPGVASSFAIQAGREIRIMVKPEEVGEDQMVLLARDIAKKIESDLEYPGQIKVNLLRETRAVEYAK
ncbi:MAG: ribonuclease Y [Oscillospiraceae bacterium]|nr:ribonuclease Y [Oscillospiraceae bacterium]